MPPSGRSEKRGEPRDPRWLLSPDAGRIAAHMYYLVVGEMPTCRLRGWVSLATKDDPTAEMVWEQHREALIADAEANGFQPWMLTKTRPTGEGVDRWREQFLTAHRY